MGHKEPWIVLIQLQMEMTQSGAAASWQPVSFQSLHRDQAKGCCQGRVQPLLRVSLVSATLGDFPKLQSTLLLLDCSPQPSLLKEKPLQSRSPSCPRDSLLPRVERLTHSDATMLGCCPSFVFDVQLLSVLWAERWISPDLVC